MAPRRVHGQPEGDGANVKFKTEEEASFWREAYLAFVRSTHSWGVADSPPMGPGSLADKALELWRVRRSDLDKPGAPYR